MSVCCECCVLSGRGLCDELITCPEESYRLWRVIVYDLETSWIRRPWPALGWKIAPNKKKNFPTLLKRSWNLSSSVLEGLAEKLQVSNL